ncbi:hypothetical protein SF83666_c22660 [Sinorhizobium fredii CCBAU 83666]|nr:hypothetical protein SF83666_c22660 [Sinorhizobium fredii CCBAU 83666]
MDLALKRRHVQISYRSSVFRTRMPNRDGYLSKITAILVCMLA